MNGKQNKQGFQAGFTLIEMLVVVSIIAIMISLVMPAGSSMIQSHRMSSAQNLIKTALTQAQAYAAKERKYAGIRFQLDGGGQQHLILVESKQIVITDSNGRGVPYNNYNVMDLYVPVDNVLPMMMPTGTLVLNANYEDIDLPLSQDGIIEDFELDAAATFVVLFNPSGQLVKKPAQCGPRVVDPGIPVAQLTYDAYANQLDLVIAGFFIPPPSEGLPLPGDEIILPTALKYSQTGLLLYKQNELETLNPVERFEYIFNPADPPDGVDNDGNGRVDDYFNKVQPLMINVYTGKLIGQEDF